MKNDPSKPPILDLIVELNIARMPTFVGDTAETAYRPRACTLVDHSSGMILHFEISQADDTESSLVARAMEELGERLRGFPKLILTRSPRISQLFKLPFRELGMDLVVRESLPMSDEAVKSILGGPLQPARREKSLVHSPGITLDHLIAFAEAGKLFYDAGPWRYLWDDDLIEIESPAGPKGTRFTQVLGAMGQTMGLGFVATREAHESIQSGQGLAPGTGHWNLIFGSLDDLAFDDGEAWEQQNLPVADDVDGDPAYPRFTRYTMSKAPAQPKVAELVWAEGLLRALAASTESEFDVGRWEKHVETMAGPTVYKFSMPILLEQLNAPKSAMPADEPPQVMMDRMLLGMQQPVQRLGRTPTAKDLEEIKNKINSGKQYPAFVPQTPAEKAQELCFQARSARGRRIVQLAREALVINPDCCDALLILAERISFDQSSLPMLEKAVRAGERQLGPEFFAANTGNFWGLTETRPYMRALGLLALELLQDGESDQAIMLLKRMLELNPGDNQGNRYLLAEAYLTPNRLNDLDELLNRSIYHDEISAEWQYTHALLAYRRQGDSPEARQELAKALKENAMVAMFLTRAGVPRDPSHGDFPPPEVDYAMRIARQLHVGWEEAEGALQWLKSMTAAPARKPAEKKKKKR